MHLALVAAGCLAALSAAYGAAGPDVQAAVPAGSAILGAEDLPAHQQDLPLLVTKERPLQPLTYVPGDLVSVAGTRLTAGAARDLASMLKAAAADGAPVRVISGYRSYQEQDALHSGYVAKFGAGRASELSAEPGHSEHQAGLAVDIADPSGGCALRPCFAETPAGAWAAENAWRYGFIVRYPADAQDVTGYSYEPWHLRHVGVTTAAKMHRASAATLEAYLQSQERPPAH
ncbi:D-alanyl-D-alanine carboxypeptidase family protein [Pseudarthrobacter sp. NPDC058362]|uniref:M15 family metallopeptidase n=1 Tax=Pseudarthrobacter sp. NPDC058362 TaxID=3346458 RepID=UPI0036565790